MQFVDRSKVPPPPAFQDETAQTERAEFLAFLRMDPARQAQSAPPSRLFEPEGGVLFALDALFRSKCAFCEARAPLHVHLLRPPEEASPLTNSAFAHLYYVWLRTDWTNHYAICAACSSSSRRQFPVRGDRRGRLPTVDEFESFANESYGIWRQPHRDHPLVIDPCRVRVYNTHFSFDLDGRIQARSLSAATTIETFQLDRQPLISARGEAFNAYLGLLFAEFERDATPSVLDFAQLEYGGAWYLLLLRLFNEASQRLSRPAVTTRDKIGERLRQIWKTEIGRKALEAAADAILAPEAVKVARVRPRRRGSIPRLSGIEIKNFKSIEHIDVDIPGPVEADISVGRVREAAALLILGENAAGKSSVLESVALALCGERVRPNIGKSSGTFILNPNLMGSTGARPPAEAEVTLRFEGDAFLKLSIGTEFGEETNADNLPPVFAYGAFRHYSDISKRSPRLGHIGTLFQPSMVLPNPESWLLGLNETRFGMVVRALRSILSIEGDFDVIEPDHANARCILVTRVDDDDAGEPIRTPLDMASSGYRSVLAMVCDIFEGVLGKSDRDLQPLDEANAVILIDEIEAHLHPRWKMQIMAALRGALPSATIIATSHDPLCVRGMHNGEVVVFNKVRNTAGIHSMPYVVEQREDLPDIEALTLEQLLTSDLFEMFTTDSPAIERKLAELAALLARRERGDAMSVEETDTLDKLHEQINDALPLGTSKAQSLVLSAVSDFLIQRRAATTQQLRGLELEARRRIIDALEGL